MYPTLSAVRADTPGLHTQDLTEGSQCCILLFTEEHGVI